VLLAYLSFSSAYFLRFFPFELTTGQFSDPDVLLLSMIIFHRGLANNLLIEITPKEMVPWINSPNRFRTFDELHLVPVKDIVPDGVVAGALPAFGISCEVYGF
jgi:hypothetical protein